MICKFSYIMELDVNNECKNWLNERNKFLFNIKVLIKSKYSIFWIFNKLNY